MQGVTRGYKGKAGSTYKQFSRHVNICIIIVCKLITNVNISGEISPGPSSVQPPWERATTPNKVPYYINHSSETTHWDHPQMLELAACLLQLNEVRFSAYRTALKLRAIQKKLSLDLVNLNAVSESFDLHGLRAQNDKILGNVLIIFTIK